MLEQVLKNDNIYQQIQAGLKEDKGPVFVSGCTDTAKWHLISLLKRSENECYKIVIVPDEIKGRQWVEGCSFFREEAFFLPAKDPLFYSADVHGNAIAKERMKCLERLMEGKGGTFIMTIDAVMDRVVPFEEIQRYRLSCDSGNILEV